MEASQGKKVWAIAAFEVDRPEYPETKSHMLKLIDQGVARQIRITFTKCFSRN